MIEAPYIMGAHARTYYEKRIKQLDAEMDAAQVRGSCEAWRPELIAGIDHAAEAERTNPEPLVGAFCRCAACLAYYMQAAD